MDRPERSLCTACQSSRLCCKRYLCDNHCSMVQPDIRRGGRPGVQALLLQAHAARGGTPGVSSLLLLRGQPAATCWCIERGAS